MIKIDEKMLEDMLFESLGTAGGIDQLNDRGLNVQYRPHTLMFRQFNLKDYGIADILRISFHSGYVFVNVLELKVVPFEYCHLTQLGRYLSCIHHVVDKNNLGNKVFIQGTLIVSSFDYKSDDAWLDTIVSSSINIFSTEYCLNGIKFVHQIPNGWHKSGTNVNIGDYLNCQQIREMHRLSCKEKELQF